MAVNDKSYPRYQSRFGRNKLKLIQNMFDQAPVVIAVLEHSDHQVQYVNKNMRKLFGNRPFPRGKPLREIWTEFEDQRKNGKSPFDLLDHVYETGESFIVNEYDIKVDRTNTGKLEERYFNFIYQALEDTSGEVYGIFIVGYDVTDHVKSRQAKRQYEERLEFTLEGAEVGFWEFDTNNRATEFISDQGKAHFGVSPQESFSYEDFLEAVHPDDRARVKQALRDVIKDPTHFEMEYRVYWPDESMHWLMSRGQPLKDEQGQVNRLVGVIMDITEQKQIERKLKEAVRLRDEFLSIASHELQTPVTSMKARAELFERRLRDDGQENYTHQARKINEQIDQLSQLTGNLLDISRLQEGRLQLEKEVFPVAEVIEEAVETIDHISDHTIEVEGLTQHRIYADRNRIGQVLTNLLSNAIKYSPEADRVVVRIDDGDELAVSVIDYGIGIAEEDRQRIFERFFKGSDPAKQTYPGFGIGLYICAQIIERHQGHIWVEDNPNGGSVFTFTLPVSEAK